ncbi:3-hydroxy-3-methylglutaryl-coenzyme A reductase [Fusarium oxysporum f. sp. cubense race 1]|uniref:hydroxymethylglutaryl-CoA reductase (NADPH) n=1 Tax=Fusarium oxysporum f. sp. cubense (strain race 1) TaxID=1229664 RepID=N4UHB2_FUSC1|nr:3-hydroxy-3-methylglutaryl-coenzyme A reductase [Fusarium oxysporum f. sp. cubense race 1]
MIRDVELQEPVRRPVTRSQTLARRLDEMKRERVERKRWEKRWEGFLQSKQDKKPKLEALKASITVRTDNRDDDSNRGRKRQRSDADRRSTVQPEPPRKKIPPLAGAGTSRDDEQRRKVLRKEWLRVLKFEHTHLLLDMVECLMSRKVDRYYLLALQILLIVFPDFDHKVVLETLPAMMRNALEETIKRVWIKGPKKVYLDYPAEGSKDERIECWKQRAELYHGIELGIESLHVGIFAVCQKGPDGLPPDLHEKVESSEHCSIFTDHFAVNMRRAACVFETTQLPGREMEFLVFVLNEMMQREAKTSKELEEAIAHLKQKAKESDGKLEDLQNFLDGIGTGTTEAISMQNAADELLEEDVDPPSESIYTNSVLDGFREKIDGYQSEIRDLKSARDTAQQELNDVKAQNGSLATEMDEMRVSHESLTKENVELQAQYNAAREKVEVLKGIVAEPNQKVVDQGAISNEQMETVEIELKREQSESKFQTQDAVDMTQLQYEANKLRLELGHWGLLYAELFSEGSATEAMTKSQSVLKLTQDLTSDIQKLVARNSALQKQVAVMEEADRDKAAVLENLNTVQQENIAELQNQSYPPPPDTNMDEATQQRNDSLHNPASSAKDSATTTITVGELKKMSEELQDLSSRLETAVQANDSLQTNSAELQIEAEVLKANLHACEDAKAKLQAECEKLRYPGLLPTKQDHCRQDFMMDIDTELLHHEVEEGNQNPLAGGRKQNGISNEWQWSPPTCERIRLRHHAKRHEVYCKGLGGTTGIQSKACQEQRLKTIKKASQCIHKKRKQLIQSRITVGELSKTIEELKKEIELASKTLEERNQQLNQKADSQKEDALQLRAKVIHIEGLESRIRDLEDEASKEDEKYILIQKQNDGLASKLVEALHKAEACGAKSVQERESLMAAADSDRKITELQDRIREQESIIQELKCEVTRKETEHGSIQGEINSLPPQRNELQRNSNEEIDQLKKQVQDQKENYTNHLKENERILQEKITSINDLQRQIKDLEDDVMKEKQKQELMENEKSELASQFCEFKEGAEADAEKRKKEIQDLQGRNLELKSEVEEQANDHCRKKEEVDKQLKDLIGQVRDLEDDIKNARASLLEKDKELESMKTARDISELRESMRDERKNLLSQIADLHQKTNFSKKEHENSVKLLELEITQLRTQLDGQAQDCIEAKAELSRCRNEHASQFTKLAESSELTRNELYELRNQLEVKDKEIARIKKLLDDTEERVANSQDEIEKRHSIIESLPLALANLRSTLDGIQSMVSAQRQSTYNAEPNYNSLQLEKGAHSDHSKSFAELRNQIQKLERCIIERCAKDDLEMKVRELQGKIMNLERSGDLLKAEILIATARRDDAEAESAKWVGKHKLLEDRLRKTEVQQLLDAKLKVEFESQESMNRIYEGLRADGDIPALMTEISENNKTLSLFFEQYKSDVNQFKSLHRRLEALGAELRDVESRVDNCIGVLGSTSVDSPPDIVNPGIAQLDEKVEWRIAKKVSLLIEKAQLKIRNLESALEAKESEAELAALQSEMAVQEADPMHPCLWEKAPSSPGVGTPGSEPDISFHTPESIHRPIKQCKSEVTEGIEGTQYTHKDSSLNLYPPLPRAHTKPEPAQAMDCEPDKRLATDRPVLAQRTGKYKARRPVVLEENASVDVDKSLSDLEGFRMTVLLYQLSAILPTEKISAALKPLAKSDHNYSLKKIGKRNLDQLNKIADIVSTQAPEPLDVWLRKALAGMKIKRQQLFSGASLQTYVVIFEIFIDLKQTMYTGKHSNPKGRAQRTILPEQDKPTNRPIRTRNVRDGPTAKSLGRAGLGVKDVKAIKVRSKLRPHPFFPLLSAYVTRSPSSNPTADMMASRSSANKSEVLRSWARIFEDAGTLQSEQVDKVRVENCIGFCQIPLAVAGPLQVTGAVALDKVYAPLATYEGTLVASCSRGCKAFNASGGIHIETLSNSMSRGPVFTFDSPDHAVIFAKDVPALKPVFSQWAGETSPYVRLQSMQPTVIGSKVHVLCSYSCGSAAGQNMVTKATQHACEMLRHSLAHKYSIRGFLIEGQLASDKKPSWGNVKKPRGVETLVWGTISPDACREVLGCTTDQLYATQQILKEGGIRNGQFGCNVNPVNIIAAMFIATGQDPASTAEASWSHLTSELHPKTGALTMSLYLPSLPVGTIGGGTGLPMQREALKMLKCDGVGAEQKQRLAGLIAAFGLALDVSTSAAITNDTFTASHMRLGRGQERANL